MPILAAERDEDHPTEARADTPHGAGPGLLEAPARAPDAANHLGILGVNVCIELLE